MSHSQKKPRPGLRGVLLGILGGSVPPRFSNTNPISNQKLVAFHTRFQTWHLKIVLGLQTLERSQCTGTV